MREACVLCGSAAGPNGNGLTRLREGSVMGDGHLAPARGMGAYSVENTRACCGTCNSMKGRHSINRLTKICRTISTHRRLQPCSATGLAVEAPQPACPGGRPKTSQTPQKLNNFGSDDQESVDGLKAGDDGSEATSSVADAKGYVDFGIFPEAFANSTSKPSRSRYLTEGKTISLTNAEFAQLVALPCHYCGKATDPPHHHNGLDRLDSTKRVYQKSLVVSCCGTCNTTKYRFSQDIFLAQCLAIARFNCLHNKPTT